MGGASLGTLWKKCPELNFRLPGPTQNSQITKSSIAQWESRLHLQTNKPVVIFPVCFSAKRFPSTGQPHASVQHQRCPSLLKDHSMRLLSWELRRPWYSPVKCPSREHCNKILNGITLFTIYLSCLDRSSLFVAKFVSHFSRCWVALESGYDSIERFPLGLSLLPVSGWAVLVYRTKQQDGGQQCLLALTRWSSTFLMLCPFKTVPRGKVTPQP